MWRRLSLSIVVCLVCLFSAARAQTVNEAKSSVVLNQAAADVWLALENPHKSVNARIRLELLDAEDRVRASTAKNLWLQPGSRAYKISLPLGDLLAEAQNGITWFRLRWQIGERSGIISLSELIRDVFELRVAASRQPFSGMNYRVRAVQPFTKTPVRNVKIEGELKFDLDTEADEDELLLKTKGETDAEGFAVLDFKIPAGKKLDSDGELRIIGRKNGLVREIEEDLDGDETNGAILLTTDKPLYQPGQDFRVRGLYLDANNTVLAGAELEFKILDESDTVLYKETLKTSDFGIAALSWKIPENAKLGAYRVVVEAGDDLSENQLYFKVSRYDLPNFAVKTKPDKTFYLPGDTTAEIIVTADYLFGKPVTKGKVRVVQEADRRWNWREQRYDVKEKDVFEGEADAEGKYVAKVDLGEEFADLQASSWRRYEDVHFAAYYTDLTTNRTEQRRFDIRLTKEPIHVYLAGGRGTRHPNLPITRYVSTFYADGTPAACDVEVKDEGKLVARFKTNSFGAGKLEFNVPKNDPGERYLDLVITARDRNNQAGTLEEHIYLEEDDAIKIELEKTIFKPGESVKIGLLSTEKNAIVYLDVVKDWTVIDSYLVNLKDGRAELKIPYNPKFRGELTIAAYGDENDDYWDEEMRASRGIIFPAQENLLLDAKFEKQVFSPNEEASVKFSVLDGAGKSIESALGVVVFDKAVEERARTDAEFGSYFSRYSRFLGYAKSFGGISLKDLNDLNLSRPISSEMQLVAEVILANNYFYPRIHHSRLNQTEAKNVYAETFKKQFAPVEEALKKQYEKNAEHPTDKDSLRTILSRNGISLDSLTDPWGNRYEPAFSIEKTQNVVTWKTAGADKRFGTKDDFIVSSLGFAYFAPVGKALDRVVADYHRRTGGFVRDLETLRAELARQDVDLSRIKDRWNRDYRITFEISGRNYLIRFYSLGPNGAHEPNYWDSDDFEVWKTAIDYFAGTENRINMVFSRAVNSGKKPFPKDEAEFKQILKENDLDFAEIRDGFGRPAYLTFSRFSRYSDKTVVENGKQRVTPVTEEAVTFHIRSHGANRSDHSDDFTLASFTGVLSEQSKETGYQSAGVKTVSFSGAKGAIRGTVEDATGAFVSNAAVTATNQSDLTQKFTATTNEKGEFLLENLPSATYSIRIDAAGFKSSVIENIEVRSQSLVEIKVTLEVGGVQETVTVTGSSTEVNTTVSTRQIQELPLNGRNVLNLVSLLPGTAVRKKTVNQSEEAVNQAEETSTPRLREYFPETLFWNPEIITDKSGRAELKFKLADNITTWKLYTIASTKNGKIGVAEKEIQAFQPFFVDLDSPRFLTEGDEIFLPTQIRNYTDRRQKVDVSMARADWFSFLNSERQQIEVAPGSSENAIFGFRSIAAVKTGKQRVTALAGKDADAIEKPVTVRPNGQEIIRTDSKLFNRSAAFEVNFPANSLPKTQRAELKIYPNLFSHVTESVEGLLQRPTGCGEQTVSSTYPNLMILKFTGEDSKLRQAALKNLKKGYDRLTGYQAASGGFSYWGGRDAADIALTAYALRFLHDAQGFIEVDGQIIRKAHDWLIGQQRADGSWTHKYYWENSENAGRTKLLTSYVARTLAMKQAETLASANTETETRASARVESLKNALQKALAYLKQRNSEIDEPYALALLGLALLDAGRAEESRAVAERLEKMAISEGGAIYWQLETNTPFYGWGTAGRVETTALVLQLLTKISRQDPEAQSSKTSELISRGTQFLLRNKDRYGVWYSTQTTINVLDAFLATLTGETAKNQTIQITLNGETLQNIPVTPDQITPIVLSWDGSQISPSNNRLEIKSTSNSSLMAQVVSAHYIDWREAAASGQNTNQSRQIRLDYQCDKTLLRVMDEVTCAVEAERVGFRGYGMLLAEIGLPPGADVNRESLQAAMDADWSLSRYDVLPDRIVIYMWSKAGGTHFNFKFRPRYGIRAQTPASRIYDYYNEEAQAMLAPIRFEVK